VFARVDPVGLSSWPPSDLENQLEGNLESSSFDPKHTLSIPNDNLAKA
jgi:hypothetical protein